MVNTFATCLDCPDIVEQIVPIWTEDVWSTLTANEKMNVENVILKTREFLRRLYPVIYADEF